MPVTRLSPMAMPISWLRAATSRSWPMPPESTSSRSKPVALPSSCTAGGTTAKIRPSPYCWKNLDARAVMPKARLSLPLRSSQSLNGMKAVPVFWPTPPNEKPFTV